MITRASFHTLGTMLAAAGLLAVTGVAAWQQTSPDDVLARSYGQALGDIDTSWGSRHAGNVWLSAGRGGFGSDLAGLVANPLAVGDRITIATRAGEPQVVEVVALEEIEGAAVGLGSARLQVVTGRPVGAAEAAKVRFLFAVEPTPAKLPAPRNDRSL